MYEEILQSFPAGSPQAARRADDYARACRCEGIVATVVMDLESDSFLVLADRVREALPLAA
ncbi:hypothetical protein ACIO3O_14575 [Streptomyces sp. NPDC087440]|uniref:hypothetical protein n=1 Tax=Streptomyces sp. NPDC087440 TaxID=3365790 RepID=UPI0038270544